MSETLKIDKFIIIEQPIGKFLICSVKPEDLLKISEPNPRNYKDELDEYLGIQREINKENLNSLKNFLNTPDASFPNSIIGSLDTNFIKKYSDKELEIFIKLEDSKRKPIFIIDGQHRLEAFKNNQDYNKPFELILALFIGMGITEQAYLFSTINSKQKRLNPSLVQDLNGLFTLEMPEKIIHVITKLLNSKENSPWKDLIKPLGKNDNKISNGIMSQYSFAKPLINLIYDSKNNYELRNELINNKNDRLKLKFVSNRILWEKYKNKLDNEYYIFLLNYFNAIKENFKSEWGSNKYILTKTTGYIAFINFFEHLYFKNGESIFLNEQKLVELFKKIKTAKFEEELILKKLTSDYYVSGIKGQKQLLDDLVKAYETF